MTDTPGVLAEGGLAASSEAGRSAAEGAGRAGGSHWGVLDQAISSATNLAPTVLVAGAVGVRSFSAFAAVMTGAILVLGLFRAAVTEPLLVRSPSTRREQGAVSGGALGVALMAGATLALALVLVAHVVDGLIGGPLLALAVVLPGLLLQDTSRYLLFARMRHRSALVNDALWLALLVVGFAGARSVDRSVTATSAMLIWGGAGTICGLVSLVQMRGVRPASPGVLLRANADVARHLILQFAALTGAGHLSLFLLGAVQDLDALGSVRAIQLLFGPLNVMFMGVYVTMLPQGVGPRTDDFTRKLGRASGALAALVLVCSAAALMVPASLGRAVLGETWDSARLLVVPYGTYLLMVCAATGPTVGLTMLERFRALTTLRLGSLPFVLVVPVAAGAVWGASGYVTAQAGLAGVLALVWWVALRRCLAASQIESEGAVVVG